MSGRLTVQRVGIFFLALHLICTQSNGCQDGWFGWDCKYKCNCTGACDRTTGECVGGCPGTSWGPGCQLRSTCSYDNRDGWYYEGRVSHTEGNNRCKQWTSATKYIDQAFYGGNKSRHLNYCRTLAYKPLRTWCYLADDKMENGGNWGWCNTLTKCSCPRGRFGINCLSECHCSDQNNSCDGSTGVCNASCHKNFKGPSCQECSDGKYGSYCAQSCSSGCKENCNNKTGQCSECKNRWYGKKCEIKCPDKCICNETGQCTSCQKGYYGDRCNDTCPSNCTKEDGCYRWKGNCKQCQVGNYGHKCNRLCSGGCKKKICNRTSGFCIEGCRSGFFDHKCDKVCHCDEGNCERNGSCPKCVPGYYGYSCNKTCPKDCKVKACRKLSGDCTGCKAKFHGPTCNETCPVNCKGNSCIQSNGSCSECSVGYAGNKCTTELFGWRYKYVCNCSGACDRRTGECTGGCPGTSWGPGCQLSSSCSYNDKQGLKYEGRITRTKTNNTCINWNKTKNYVESKFYGGSKSRHVNYCRNLNDSGPLTTWCYTTADGKNWDWCDSLTECSCPNGRFGINCLSECHCRDKNNTCNGETGKCVYGCNPNFKGPYCQECIVGKYGVYCGQYCSAKCKDACDKDNGNCLECKDGWQGVQCRAKCPNHCNGTCNKTTGECKSCRRGFYGHYCRIPCPVNCTVTHGCDKRHGICKQCPDGSYGDNCREFCSSGCEGKVCNKTAGACVNGCRPGRFDETCDKICHCANDSCERDGNCPECSPGYYGYSCNETCPENCNSTKCYKGDGSCDNCTSGYHGSHCRKKCSRNCEAFCKQDGECLGCKAGYYGHNCTNICPDNCTNSTCEQFSGNCIGCISKYHGPICNETCGENCKGSSCIQSNGSCIECKTGYHGATCDSRCPENCTDEGCSKDTSECFRCDSGTYGSHCQKQCLSRCKYQQCSKELGNCQVCVAGFYGPSCDQSCPINCGYNTCQQDSGLCLTCNVGFYGRWCNSTCNEGCSAICAINGTCACKPGYKGRSCAAECADGKHGYYCSQNCSLGCNGTCTKSTGNCLKCKDGLYGDKCNMTCPQNCNSTCKMKSGNCNWCKAGHYGDKCNFTCPTNCTERHGCSKNTGNCLNCIEGSYGNKCLKLCSPGCDGKKCNKTTGVCINGCLPGRFDLTCDKFCHCVNGSCEQDGYCSECTPGYYGYSCNESCPLSCNGGKCSKGDGSCSDCPPGYYGSHCRQKCSATCGNGCKQENGECTECVTGYYGHNCTNTCPKYCKMNTCKRFSGYCTGCAFKYHGPKCNKTCPVNCTNDVCSQDTGLCTECLAGSYGNFCSQACPDKCGSQTCLQESGHCLTCPDGNYGNKCAQKCAKGCYGPCKKEDGTCKCQKGYTGKNCTEETMSATKVAVGVIFAILLLLVIVLVIYYIRRKRTAETDKDKNNLELKCNAEENMYVNFRDGQANEAVANDQEEALYDDTSLLFDNRALPVDSLPDFVKYMHQRNCGFEEEYKTIKSGPTKEWSIGINKELQAKNRFKNIIPYDENRIVISIINNDPLSDYINASYITGYGNPKEFIAAQGPNPSSVNDFIRMLWEYNVPCIVMVTNLREKEKSKCEKYWPRVRNTVSFGEVSVTLKNATIYPYYQLRKLILQKGEETRDLVQLQFTDWPDHGVPQSASAFLAFHQRAQEFYDIKRGPTVVHCSAGVGRTGTFLAMDYLLKQAASEGKVSIYNCVLELRKYRVNMVQNLDQYKFVHEALLVALHCGTMLHPASNFETWDSENHIDVLRKQFQVLEKLNPRLDKGDYSASLEPANIHKNRSRDRVPTNSGRPLLMTSVHRGNDYINAVFVKTSSKETSMIVTQSPMATTMVDFWRMVYDYNCTVVVALNDIGSEEFPTYVPETAQSYGPFHVKLKSLSTEDHYVRRWLAYQYKKGEERVLHHLAIHPHDNGRKLPDPTVFLSLIDCVNVVHARDLKGRIVLHCEYGFEHSGLFCALRQIAHKITEQQEVDVFSAVKQIRHSRPEFIPSLEHYQWLHDAAREHVKSFSTYANFT